MKKVCLILVLAPLLSASGMSPAQSQERRISAAPTKTQNSQQSEQRESRSRATQSSGTSGNNAASGGPDTSRGAAMERGGYTIDDANEHGPVVSVETGLDRTPNK